MENTRIYTNGKSLFTLENYAPNAAVCFVNGITLHSKVDKSTARAMHAKGQLHYVFGCGNRKEISNKPLNRKMKLNNFKIS